MCEGKTNYALKPEPFSRQNILSLYTEKCLQRINMWMGVSNSVAIMERITDCSLRLSRAQPVLYIKRMTLLALFLLFWLWIWLTISLYFLLGGCSDISKYLNKIPSGVFSGQHHSCSCIWSTSKLDCLWYFLTAN